MRFFGFVIVAAVVTGGLVLNGQKGGYQSPLDKLPLPPPEQPMPYSHKLHVGQLSLECKHCHELDEDGFFMLFPAEQTCMECHSAVKTESPHIQKLAEYARSGEAIEWAQIYRVPDYVWFAHESHSADAGITCDTCHGPVAEREVMFKEKATNMVSCMECHAKHRAPNDCDFCHDPG